MDGSYTVSTASVANQSAGHYPLQKFCSGAPPLAPMHWHYAAAVAHKKTPPLATSGGVGSDVGRDVLVSG